MGTTATYDPETDELIVRDKCQNYLMFLAKLYIFCLQVNTPTPLAQKYWITNGACHAKHVVVFAQLYVDGKNEGIHGVLVPCRDKNLNVSRLPFEILNIDFEHF